MSYDPEHPYSSRFKQWATPGRYMGTVLGAGLAGKYVPMHRPAVGIPAMMAGALGGSLIGGAITGSPGLIHGAISQRKDRPHEWNEAMSNTLDQLKGQLAAKTSAFTTHLRPNEVEEQAIRDAFALYKIAAPWGAKLQGAWQGAKALGSHLQGAGNAVKTTFQANKALGAPGLANAGQAMQSGLDHLRQTGATKTLGRIGRAGALAGGGFLAGRAMAPNQQQQVPPNPYGQVL